MLKPASKFNLECKIHGRAQTILCMDSRCGGRRLCCELCKQKDHRDHHCRQFQDLNAILNRLEPIQKEARSLQSAISKASQTLNKYQQDCNEVTKIIQASQLTITSKVVPPFSFLRLIEEGKLGSHCEGMVKQQQDKQFDNLASFIKFLEDPRIQTQQDLRQIIEVVNERIQKSFNTLKTKIENSFSEFHHEMQKCEIKNWYEIYRSKYFIEFKQKPFSREPKTKSNNSMEENKELSFPYNLNLDREMTKMIEEMFEEVFQIRPLTGDNGQNINPSNIISMEQIVKQQSENVMPMVHRPHKKYERHVMSSKNQNNVIKKSEILGRISMLVVNLNYSNNLKEFIIEGPNQFDIQCLRKLAACFPQLTKLNYIWNFEESGLQLQKEQVFFQKSRSLEKSTKNFEMSQELLDVYGQFQNLENLSIHQVQLFAYNDNKIRNRKIKHLTIGEYVNSNQEQILPVCIKKEVLLFSGLITLNIFNVKKIDGNFMEEIINKNMETLRTVWLSECIQLEDSFYRALRHCKIQLLMFDQIKKIAHTLFIPETLKTLIIDNCELHCAVPFVGLGKALNMTNFSIFDSIFHEAIEIGDNIISQLASIPDCKIQYLNMAQCKSVTDSSLKLMASMPRLVELCIDNTNICLLALSNHLKVIQKLKKLGIVGLQLQLSEQTRRSSGNLKLKTILQEIIIKSPKLRLISLSFEDGLFNLDMDFLINLKHVSISAIHSHRDYRKKLLKEFAENLRKNGKSVNIV